MRDGTLSGILFLFGLILLSFILSHLYACLGGTALSIDLMPGRRTVVRLSYLETPVDERARSARCKTNLEKLQIKW